MTLFRPLRDRLLVEPLEADKVSAGGVVLPDAAQEKPARGRVLAAGPGARDDRGETVEMEVREGDVVVYSRYGGVEIDVDGDKLLVLREADVLGVEDE